MIEPSKLILPASIGPTCGACGSDRLWTCSLDKQSYCMKCEPPAQVLKRLRQEKSLQKELERGVVDHILDMECEDYGVKDIHDLNEIDRREGRIKDDPELPYVPFRGKVITLG